MPLRHRFDADRNALFLELRGEVTDEDLLRYVEEATRRPGEPTGHVELVDLRGVDVTRVEGRTLRRIAHQFGQSEKAPQRVRVALVADSDVSYGLARMYQAFRADSPLDLRVFRDMGEARAWLGLDEDASL